MKPLNLNQSKLKTAISIAFASTLALTTPLAANATEVQPYQLPAGNLGQALNQLASQSGFVIYVDASLTNGLNTNSINGDFTPEQALTLLLEGTGLVFSKEQDGSYRIYALSRHSQSQAKEFDTITVTGEFSERSLADTHSSVSVLTEEALAISDASRAYDAMRRTPNLTPVPPDFLPSIRGVRSDGPAGLANLSTSSVPRASLIVDDIPRLQRFTNNSYQSLFDIQQVEVLRGPQATLRGTSSISGAYVIKTNDPVFDQEGMIQTEVNWNEFSKLGYRTAGMYNSELVEDELAARFVVEYLEDRNPIQVYDDGSAPAGTDLDRLSAYDALSLRGKFLYEPEDLQDLSALFRLEYQRGRDIAFDSWVWGGEAADWAPDGISRDPEDRFYGYSGGHIISDTEDKSAAADIRYQLDSGELRFISSYSESLTEEADDAVYFVSFDEFKRKKVTQDILYSGEFNRYLNGLLGFSYSRETFHSKTGGYFPTDTEGELTSISLFADANYALNDQLSLLLGGRLMRSKSIYEGTVFLPVSVDQEKTVFLPKMGLAYDLAPEQSVFTTIRRGFNTGGGGIDTSAFEFFEYDPEYAWTYELGYRGELPEHNLSLSVTAFYNQYDDYQLEYSPDPGVSRILNYDGDSYGLEFESRYAISEDLTLMTGVGLLHTEVDAPTEDIDGNRFGEDPSLTFSSSLIWQASKDLSLDISANYVGEYYDSFLEAEHTESGDYWNVDIGASYHINNIKLRGYVRNLFDEFQYYKKQYELGSGYALPPREIGLILTAKF